MALVAVVVAGADAPLVSSPTPLHADCGDIAVVCIPAREALAICATM